MEIWLPVVALVKVNVDPYDLSDYVGKGYVKDVELEWAIREIAEEPVLDTDAVALFEGLSSPEEVETKGCSSDTLNAIRQQLNKL